MTVIFCGVAAVLLIALDYPRAAIAVVVLTAIHVILGEK